MKTGTEDWNMETKCSLGSSKFASCKLGQVLMGCMFVAPWNLHKNVRLSARRLSSSIRGPSVTSKGQLKCDVTRAATRFRLSAKQTSPFKSAGGRQFSRLLAAEVCASAVVMLDKPCSEVV